MTIRKKVSNFRSHQAKKLSLDDKQIKELKSLCDKALEHKEAFESYYDNHMTSPQRNVAMFDKYDQIVNALNTFMEGVAKHSADNIELETITEDKQNNNKMLTQSKQKADKKAKTKQTQGKQDTNKYTMIRILKEVYHPFQEAVEEEEGSKHYSITLLKKFMAAYADPEKRTDLHNLIHLKKK